MSITIKEWEEHFATLTPERRKELKSAFECLKADPVFKQHFDWTGIFALSTSLDIVEMRIERDINERKNQP